MATAAVESMHLFFCHACHSNMYPKMPDYLCSNCDSGAIEELEEEARNAQQEENNRHSENNHDPFERFGFLNNRRRDSSQRSGPRRIVLHIGSIDGNDLMQINSSNSPLGGLDRFFEQLSSNLGLPVMGGPNMNFLGDYAWGINGLDNIVTQLLNQVENAGPAPAEEEKINEIPTITITQKDIDENLECPVCKDDFEIGMVVKKLPCGHLFHSYCVDTWLKKHDSCPVCRRSLSGEEPAS